MTQQPPRPPAQKASEDNAPWGWIYFSVVVFAVLVILGLWAFSRAFTPSGLAP